MKNLNLLILLTVTVFCFSCTPEEEEVLEGTSVSEVKNNDDNYTDVYATEGEEESHPAEKKKD